MEHKTDKRTKNLTLRDIHVGDWVQVWSEKTERYSPPMKIISIHDDGIIYLVTSDEERCTPWEENIKNVDALPITPELLIGFGFEVKGTSLPYSKRKSLVFYKDKYKILITGYSYKYFHDFIQGVYDGFPEILNLEWKGVEK